MLLIDSNYIYHCTKERIEHGKVKRELIQLLAQRLYLLEKLEKE